jgi:diguanylate cyclase (GGDEF)-like protein
MTHETPTGARWERLLSARDAMLIDAGLAGERSVARARLAMMVVLTAIPVQAVLTRPDHPENWVGMVGTAVALLVAVAVLVVLRRGYYRPWLGLATSIYDVSSVSAILATFIVLGLPQIAVNSRIIFEIYLLALGATCLRYDSRVPLVAGAVAVVQYAALIFVVQGRWDLADPRYAGYGTFAWGDQVGRLIILGIAAMLSWTILRRAERLRQLTMHDPLTGLLNRNVLEERVREEVMRARRHHRPLAVAMIDLDLFKRFNDSFGHAAGDVTLRVFSRKLLEAVRRTDIVARFGGEEFVIVMPETQGPDAALKLEQIRHELEGMHLQAPGSAGGHLTLSAGVATFDPARDSGLEILQRADDLLLQAKRGGRNRIVGE